MDFLSAVPMSSALSVLVIFCVKRRAFGDVDAVRPVRAAEAMARFP